MHTCSIQSIQNMYMHYFYIEQQVAILLGMSPTLGTVVSGQLSNQHVPSAISVFCHKELAWLSG